MNTAYMHGRIQLLHSSLRATFRVHLFGPNYIRLSRSLLTPLLAVLDGQVDTHLYETLALHLHNNPGRL